MFCPQCGAQRLDPAARYCRSCGRQLPRSDHSGQQTSSAYRGLPYQQPPPQGPARPSTQGSMWSAQPPAQFVPTAATPTGQIHPMVVGILGFFLLIIGFAVGYVVMINVPLSG